MSQPVVRLTTSRKPALASIVEIPSGEVLPGGRVVCDDIYELFEDEVLADVGALTPAAMRAVDSGLKAALALI
jgi:mRNA interferase MazF